MSPSRTVKLVLRYDGAAYQGWQRQPDAPTIQAAVEAAVRAVTGEAAVVHGSGRTDAGVHALGQVAHFVTGSALSPEVLVRALNANLPEDIAVREAADVSAGFHARRSAWRKTYFYQFAVSRERHPLLRRQHFELRAWPDVRAMRDAASRLVGRHDFRSFATEADGVEDTVRELFALRVLHGRTRLRVFATGDGFLQHMVRTLAGLLLRVGTGRETPERVDAILAARDRRQGPAALPAHALFLWRVDY